jgi:5-(carboxyamino)imidazole ribonucleotide mutase
MKGKVVILLGSKSDMEFGTKIAGHLKKFGIDYEFRIASAHRSTEKVLQMLSEYEDEKVVFITVAGKLDALSGIVAANTAHAVLACPPDTDDFHKLSYSRKTEIFSSLDVPSVASFGLIIGSEMAAIQAAKILALEDAELARTLSSLIPREK